MRRSNILLQRIAVALALLAPPASAIAAAARGDGQYRPALMAALRALGVVPGAEVVIGDGVFRVEDMGMVCPKGTGECTISVKVKLVR